MAAALLGLFHFLGGGQRKPKQEKKKKKKHCLGIEADSSEWKMSGAVGGQEVRQALSH